MRTATFSRPSIFVASLIAALAAACAGAAPPPPQPQAQAQPQPIAAATPAPQREHLEFKVRADFFAGLAGDKAAFDRAMKVCDDVLATRPDDAEALVWRGAGRLWESGMAFRTGDVDGGRKLWDRALAEMDRAVALAPDQVGVRIPRGAALLGAAPHLPDPAMTRPLYERAATDYEVTLRIQEPTMGKLSTHAREELLFGLADVEAHLGDTDKARALFERLVRDVPDSQLLPYARTWLSGGKPDARPACTGCHSG